jgi:hypothetical protein
MRSPPYFKPAFHPKFAILDHTFSLLNASTYYVFTVSQIPQTTPSETEIYLGSTVTVMAAVTPPTLLYYDSLAETRHYRHFHTKILLDYKIQTTR